MSSNGQTIIVGETTVGRLYISNDGASTWAETQPAGNVDKTWQTSSMSSDGNIMLAGVFGGRLYLGLTPTTNASSGGSISAPSCGNAAPTNAPNLFQITAKGNTATVYFVPVSGPNDKYYVSYGFDQKAEGFGVEFNYADSSGVIPYTINYLFPGTWYFKVRGGNGCMPGSWSGVMSVKVTAFGSSLSSANSGANNVLGAATQASVVACMSYTVQAGDSLWSIASSHLGNGSQFGSIMQKNNLSSSLIHTGQVLKVGC